MSSYTYKLVLEILGLFERAYILWESFIPP
jgi:hypothetical protein